MEDKIEWYAEDKEKVSGDAKQEEGLWQGRYRYRIRVLYDLDELSRITNGHSEFNEKVKLFLDDKIGHIIRTDSSVISPGGRAFIGLLPNKKVRLTPLLLQQRKMCGQPESNRNVGFQAPNRLVRIRVKTSQIDIESTIFFIVGLLS